MRGPISRLRSAGRVWMDRRVLGRSDPQDVPSRPLVLQQIIAALVNRPWPDASSRELRDRGDSVMVRKECVEGGEYEDSDFGSDG